MNCVFASNIYYQNGPTWEFTFDRGLAGCQNAGINTLVASNGNSQQFNGTLQNFYLNGPQSNWVEGLQKDTCGQPQTIAISTPQNITLYSQSSVCGAIANFAATASSPCPDSLRITYSPNSGTLFPVGNTNVTATAQDASGSAVSSYFTVTVKDTTPPALQTKDTTVRLNKNSYAYITPTSVIASLTDNCATQLEPPGYTVYPTSFTSTGTYTVTVVANDKYNNTVTKYATVTVLPYKKGSFTGDAMITAGNTKALQANELAVRISPNPSNDHFTLVIQNSNSNKLSVTVIDLAGKVLETFSNTHVNQSVQFGSSYVAGTYLAVIGDGENKRVYKLVKF